MGPIAPFSQMRQLGGQAEWRSASTSLCQDEMRETEREMGRPRGTGLFAAPLIPVSPEASGAPAKIDQSRQPPLISIKINWEAP